MGSRTGYATWRTQGTNVVTYDYCRAENPHHRCIAERTEGASTPAEDVTSITFTKCEFIRDESRETDTGIYGHKYSAIGNINPRDTQISNFTMEDCFADWRNAEGPDYSWVNTGTDTAVMFKIEGIDEAEFLGCEFRHGGNDYGSTPNGNNYISTTLKTDNGSPVVDLTIQDCTFSGALVLSAESSDDLDTLVIEGSHLQADGRFGQSSAIWGIQYPTLVIQEHNSNPTVIDHIIGSVLRMGKDDFNDFPSTKSWICTDLTANGESASVEPLFVSYYSSMTGEGVPPTLSQMDQSATNFQSSNTFTKSLCAEFEFSPDDDTNIREP